LLTFSYQQSRRLYASAQQQALGEQRRQEFSNAADSLATYLSIAKLAQSNAVQSTSVQAQFSDGLLADEMLYADACFEAQRYQQALTSYQYLAYNKQPINDSREKISQLQQIKYDAAYATTVTIRAMLAKLAKRIPQNSPPSLSSKTALTNSEVQPSVATRATIDRTFIDVYPDHPRALSVAIQAGQYAFNIDDYNAVTFYSDFVLNFYGINTQLESITSQLENINTSRFSKKIAMVPDKISTTAKKHIQTVSRLKADAFYQQARYQQAESAYALVLQFTEPNDVTKIKIHNLLASSIYFQAQAVKVGAPLVAVSHLLRLGKQVPGSHYRATAEFDAAIILLEQKKWQRAIDVLLTIEKRYPNHPQHHSIAAKLVYAYEALAQWQLAAVQLLNIVKTTDDETIRRESQYTAADYFFRVGNIAKAIISFRAYAHAYPQPFDLAQEVRFKMSELYQQTNEPNKEYYWYRKLISFHDKAVQQQTSSDRSNYLASVAALNLAKVHQVAFTRTKLTLPLAKALKKKQKAMKSAIHYYQKLLSYQRNEFVPQATFHLAKMYSQLAQDVMSSQKPNNLDSLALEEYGYILEEIAYPFEEKAIEIHASNAQRAWQNVFDLWVEKSFQQLAELEPAQYNKQERAINAVDTLY